MTTSAAVSPRKIVQAGSFTNPMEVAYPLASVSHLRVYVERNGVLTQLSIGLDYSVFGVGDPDGFTLIFVEPDRWNAQRWAVRVTGPYEQSADLSLGGTFGTLYENALDALSRQIQDLGDRVSRAIVLDTAEELSTRLVFRRLTRSAYEAIETPDEGTLYFITGD